MSHARVNIEKPRKPLPFKRGTIIPSRSALLFQRYRAFPAIAKTSAKLDADAIFLQGDGCVLKARGSSMKTVASISFLDNHSLSMDVEAVHQVEISDPMEVDAGLWTASLLIRADSGTIAIQLLTDNPEKLVVKTASA